MRVTDDGAGPPRFPRSGGYGLVGMRERVEALGGTLSVGPGADVGWAVTATLPAPGDGHRDGHRRDAVRAGRPDAARGAENDGGPAGGRDGESGGDAGHDPGSRSGGAGWQRPVTS